MIYLTLTLMTLLFQVLESFKEIKINRKYLRWIFFGLICIVSGFRFQVGTDYQHYQDIYNSLLRGEPSYVEVAYKILNYPFFIFGESGFYVLIFAVSTLILYSFNYFVSNFIDKKYYFLSWFFILSLGMVFSSYNAIRQYIAIAVFIFSIPSIKNKKIVNYIGFVIVACLFHSSAIVLVMLLPIFFLDTKYSDKIDKGYIVIYGLSIIFLIVDFRELLKVVWFIVPQRWNWYIVSDFFNSRNYSAVVKQVMPNILQIFVLTSMRSSMLYGSKKKHRIDFETLTYYSFLLFVALSNTFYGIMVLQRFVLYFEIFMIPVIISIIMNRHIKIHKYRIESEWILLALILYFADFYLYLIYIRNAHDIIPYRTILEVLL